MEVVSETNEFDNRINQQAALAQVIMGLGGFIQLGP